nr:MAG TPA: hypothetical protein [Caudoviricetes sp.]
MEQKRKNVFYRTAGASVSKTKKYGNDSHKKLHRFSDTTNNRERIHYII